MSEEMNQTNGIDEEAKKGGEDEKEIKEAEKKYSDADLNEIINQKFAKWQEKQDKAVADAKAEAEKLAKMNADQKAQYEAEQKDKLISEMQSQLQQIAMGKVATEVERYTISAPSFNLYVALCGGISAARKQRVVSQYYKEHPDSKLTEKEIIANYRKGR